MQGMGQAIEEALIAAVAIIAVVCFAMGGLAFWGLPKLWNLVKPWLHSITA